MQIKIKRYCVGGILLLIGSLLGLMGPQQLVHAASTTPMTPTLYFHGAPSSYRSERHMVGAAKKAGVTKSVIRADVAASGRVTLVGKFRPTSRTPIVEVNFLNTRNTNYVTNGRWVRNVVRKLQATYHFRQMNMVGHSTGNLAIAYYLLANSTNRRLPKLAKFVSLGGHYDGVLNEGDWPHRIRLTAAGRPTPMDSAYRRLLKLRQRYPKKQTAVLNIYGDLGNGTDSDGRVTNNSSKSLRYLLAKRAKSYHERQFKGAGAQHSRLHHNAQVDRTMIKFLWDK
nr:alpha/beta hydrolase [Levilactobacillus namurensis]